MGNWTADFRSNHTALIVHDGLSMRRFSFLMVQLRFI